MACEGKTNESGERKSGHTVTHGVFSFYENICQRRNEYDRVPEIGIVHRMIKDRDEVCGQLFVVRALIEHRKGEAYAASGI